MPEDRNYRDARTGQFVTDEYAKENPDTTVSEDAYEGPAVPVAESPAIEVPLQSPPEVEDAEDSDPDEAV